MLTAFDDFRISLICSIPGAGSEVTRFVQADLTSSVRQNTSEGALGVKWLLTTVFALFSLSEASDI